ncbi:MAG: hypothetical protein HFF62_06015 [Oscillospiraceae bacterium]|nr:hypothetical protein [Oscillospiraceae bacterium]
MKTAIKDSIDLDRLVDYRAEYTAVIEKYQISGDNLTGLCPFHQDRNNSFSANLITGQWSCFTEGEKGNFLHFWAMLHGYSRDETTRAYKEILEKYGVDTGGSKKKEPSDPPKPYTLQQYSADKRLPVEWLSSVCQLSTEQDYWDGTDWLKIPYLDESGKVVTYRKRYGNKAFRWNKGVQTTLYGLWQLPEIRKKGWAILVEGESDAQTLWYLGFPAIGVPGASTFKPKQAAMLQGLTLYIHQEPDRGGETFVEKTLQSLQRGGFRDKVKLWSCKDLGTKDPSDLYIQQGTGAARLVLQAVKNAKPVDLKQALTPEDIPAADWFEPGSVTLADLHPENNRRYGWNDIGNGNLFADWYKNEARYVPERKKWFVYNGKAWNPDIGNLRVMEMCKCLADQLAIYALSLEDEQKRQGYLKFVGSWQRRSNRETILKDAASVYPVEISAFDSDPLLFNCLNGTLDLRTREFRPHSPSDMLSMMSGVKYNPKAKSELWENTVAAAMQEDMDKTVFLQKAMGYGVTGDISEECFFILYGPTARNGKGTIMETYIHMLGDYGRTSKPETIAQKQTVNSGGPSEDIARLAGARVVNISEPGKQMVLSAALVKTLTGGDTVTARFLNENSFEFVPQFKLFVNTNHLPKVTDVTVFNSGRVKVIPFERHFTEAERDRGLKEKLAQEDNLSGVLNWCLDGLWLMRETGLTPPAAVKTATAQYQRDSDKISRFVEEMLEPALGCEVRTEDAYRAYQDWCTRNGQVAEGMPSWKQSMGIYVEMKRKRPVGSDRTATLKWLICNMRLRV